MPILKACSSCLRLKSHLCHKILRKALPCCILHLNFGRHCSQCALQRYPSGGSNGRGSSGQGSSNAGSVVKVHDNGPAALLTSFDDAQFFASVEMGTPGQPLNVVFYTGSYNIWLPSSKAKSFALFFKQQLYNTWKQDGAIVTMPYVFGNTKGFVSND
ncbi:Vacuolar aspartic protease [Halotydeus destructor]|nr:Vacuolar aspartic protease [Halotydeus destructor]